jgi:hypothetical protein
MISIRKTGHVVDRQQQRGLRNDILEFILDFGHVEDRKGCAYYCVRERELPSYLAGSEIAKKARPWVVITGGRGDLVITTYPNKNARRRVRQLSRIGRFHDRARNPLLESA